MSRPRTQRSGALRIAAALTVSLLLSNPAAAVEVPRTYPPARDPVRDALDTLGPKRLGVDSAGLLWAADGKRVIFVGGGGRVVRSVDLPGQPRTGGGDADAGAVHGAAVRDVAADSRWGVLLLDAAGTTLRRVDLDGSSSRVLVLPDAAGHVAWVDADHAALGLTLAADAVEIRPLGGGGPPRRLWPGVPPVPATPGGYFERSLVPLVRDGRLYALDSVSGELRVFDLADGGELLRATLPNSRFDDLDAWRRGLGRTLGEAGRVRSWLYTVLRLGVGEDGAAWVVSDCRAERRRAVVHRVPLPPAGDGAASPAAVVEEYQVPLDRACCSLDFARWDDRLIFNLSLPPSPCTQVQTFVPVREDAGDGGGDGG
jgi:hypothetical protein